MPVPVGTLCWGLVVYSKNDPFAGGNCTWCGRWTPPGERLGVPHDPPISPESVQPNIELELLRDRQQAKTGFVQPDDGGFTDRENWFREVSKLNQDKA
jgi:hypothetical protein